MWPVAAAESMNTEDLLSFCKTENPSGKKNDNHQDMKINNRQLLLLWSPKFTSHTIEEVPVNILILKEMIWKFPQSRSSCLPLSGKSTTTFVRWGVKTTDLETEVPLWNLRDHHSGEKLHHNVTLIWDHDFHCRNKWPQAACSFRKCGATFSHICYGTFSSPVSFSITPPPCMFFPLSVWVTPRQSQS